MKHHSVDNFIAALLRSDKNCCEKLLAQGMDFQASSRLFVEILESGIPLLLVSRLYKLGLETHFKGLFLPSGESILSKLNEALTSCSIAQQRMSNRFLQLLSGLEELLNRVVWLKGTSLSRDLYELPSDRISNDFDLLLEPEHIQEVYDRLVALGFKPQWQDPGHCHQYLAGPTGQVSDLFILPSAELVPYNVTMIQNDWPTIELKCDPLDIGLRFQESSRFFAELQPCHWQGKTFFAPSYIDHLILQLTHFHKHGLHGWSWLYDMHLLSLIINKDESQWLEFVRRCNSEGACVSAFLGLSELAKLLDSPVPDWVITALKEKSGNPIFREAAKHVDISFLWNCRNIFELVINTLVTGDRKRKLRILASCLFPNDDFIQAYYLTSAARTLSKTYLARVLNFFVLVLPASVIRRTFGPFIWGTLYRQNDH